MRASIDFSGNLVFDKLENIQINRSARLRSIWFSKLMSLHEKEEKLQCHGKLSFPNRLQTHYLSVLSFLSSGALGAQQCK